MRENPERFSEAMDLLQDAAAHQFKIGQIVAWPGLSGGQRAVALVITCLEHFNERPARAAEVAQFMGMDQGKIEKLFTTVEHPPYHFTDLEGVGWSFQPAQSLEYGQA